MVFLLIISFMFLIMCEVPGLIKNKYWKELIAFSVLMSIAFTISLLYTLGINIPNPVKNTQYFVKNLMHLSYD